MTESRPRPSSIDTPASPPASVRERHASWLELFFDLVAVAGIGQLAHLLHGEVTGADLGLYVVLFAAFWFVWITFTLYGNVAAERTRVATLLGGMAMLAVMAAAVPGIAGHNAQHSRAFVIAYLIARAIGSGTWRRRGELLLDWPAAQAGVSAVPWIVSLWAHGGAERWWWAAGIGLDLLITFLSSGERMLRQLRERNAELDQRRVAAAERHGGPASGPPAGTRLLVAYTDPEHLGERLGLFVLIAIGEALVQLISAAAEVDWNRHLTSLVIACFLLLILAWAMSLYRGYGGVPNLTEYAVPLRAVLIMQAITAAALGCLAAGMGTAVGEAEHPPPHWTWVVGGATALYALIATLAALVSGRLRRPASWAISALGAAGMVVAILRTQVTPQATMWTLAGSLAIFLQATARPPTLRRRSAPGAQSPPESSSSR